MKHFIIAILFFLMLGTSVYASEVKGNLQGFVISADRNRQIAEIQIQINQIKVLIMELQRLLNQLRGL